MLVHLQQLALMDTLLTNWDGIRLRMEPLSPAAAARLAELGRLLDQVRSADDLARVVDDLLDFTIDTPAGAYVRELVGRSSLGGRAAGLRAIEPLVPAAAEEEGPDSPDLALQAGRDLASAVAAEAGIQQVPVFFATNRKPGARPQDLFLGEPAGGISLGLASVTIPVAKHRIGKVERPRWWTLFPDTNPEHRFITIAGVSPFDRTAFLTAIESAVVNADAPELLVFLHGYNVTFEEAARRAAQLAYDLSFSGIVVLFSWPSRGGLAQYPADEERAQASADRLADFLRTLAGGPWRSVHLVAHSMGNRVMLLGLADNPRPALPFGQIVFVAADIYVEVFGPKWQKLLSAGVLPATSYISRRDWALRCSHLFHRADRIGFAQDSPYLAAGVDTVDATAVDTSLGGHGYFSSERSLLADLGLLLRKGLSPPDRGLRAGPGVRYWTFPR